LDFNLVPNLFIDLVLCSLKKLDIFLFILYPGIKSQVSFTFIMPSIGFLFNNLVETDTFPPALVIKSLSTNGVPALTTSISLAPPP
jgi:hypothetical protein